MNFTALRCGSGVAAFVSALGPLLSADTVLHLLEYAGNLIQLILGQFFQGVLSSLTVNDRVKVFRIHVQLGRFCNRPKRADGGLPAAFLRCCHNFYLYFPALICSSFAMLRS